MIRIEKNRVTDDCKNLGWLVRAMAKTHDSDTKYRVDVIRSIGGELVTTDCRRLHVLDIKGTRLEETLPEGYYKLAKCTKTLVILSKITDEYGLRYPEYKKLFEQETSKIDIPNGKDALEHGLTTIYRNTKCDAVNHNYLVDVIDGDTPFTLDEEESPHKPLIFRNCTKKAAVMPMRV
jgi:hypothetical protein